MKENWRLYRANRSRTLRPVPIGSHGETMLRFLRPGFHSGTLPKLYARLRKAGRRADARALHKHAEALHHVEASLQHFIEREVVRLLEGSKGWGAARLRVGDVETGTNRVTIELSCPNLGSESLAVAFEEHAGWLLARVAREGWLQNLSDSQVHALANALAGLYKLSGVHLIHEQIDACLGPKLQLYALTDAGLVVSPRDGREAEAVYDLEDSPVLPPRVTAGVGLCAFPTLAAGQLRFDLVPITWQDWVETWVQDQVGGATLKPFLGEVRLLPDRMGQIKP
jgi:hypothetical protein